jgi:eukaryotic-like serine/threonine-protein kinase
VTPEEWQRVRPILESALEVPAANRAAFLDTACTDSSLRREVESLIFSHEQASTDSLNSLPISSFAEEAQFTLPAGKRIGAYEILEEIAQGGMGAVYRAVRADGQYKQQVALKIVRADIGAGMTASRFRNERQILASLDHPNIARMLDGGTTADGLPYLVMEFIDGLPITEYCDQKKVTVDERLQLFRTVCAAVHYAHQRLVIHRDIKPGNILVTSEGVPKLLDFGIAKILDPELLGNVTLTSAGLLVMTPEYASPEQLQGKTITTATDVYSLGLVLYELLAGRPAYRFTSRMPYQVARAVLETDPEKPSTAIRRRETTEERPQEKSVLTPEVVSSLRGASVEKLERSLSGDLDNIVLKAIRKEPNLRYSSADQLSDDIRRHLENLPVLARKSTFAYRCRKYIARHKFGMASVVLITLSLLAGIISATREARIARANQLRAEQRFNDVRKLANSLMFEIHDSIKDLPGATKAREILASDARQYLDSLSREANGDPSLQHDMAAAYDRLGDVYGSIGAANLGDFAAASQSYAKALAIRESLAAANPKDSQLQMELADEYFRVEGIQQSNGDFASALKTVQRALALLQKSGAAGNDIKLQDRIGGQYYSAARLLERTGDASAALEDYRKAASFHEYVTADVAANVLSRAHLVADYNGMAKMRAQKNQMDEAIAISTKALSIMEQLSDANPTNATVSEYLAESYNMLADLYQNDKDLPAALQNHRAANRIFRRLMIGDPSNQLAAANVAFSGEAIGEILVRQRDTIDGLNALRQAVATANVRGSKTLWDASALSVSYTGLGTAYMILAGRASSSPEKLTDWRESRSWFQKASAIWSQKQYQGKHDPNGHDQATYISGQIGYCDAQIRKLTPQTKRKPANRATHSPAAP